jgi:nicotinamidase-related amidase
MATINLAQSALLLIDFQARLMPAIHGAEEIIEGASRLLKAASLLKVPVVVTEQNPKGLGPTTDRLVIDGFPRVAKTTFDASDAVLPLVEQKQQLIIAGCEAHVCVLQTATGLRQKGQEVFVVEDAIGSRAAANRLAAIRRMEQAGCGIVTLEMVMFEWLSSSDHPQFREIMSLIR